MILKRSYFLRLMYTQWTKTILYRSRRDLLAQHKRWIEAAGGDLAGYEIELAPGVSYSGEGLEGLKGRKAKSAGLANTKQDLEGLFA